MFGGLKQGLNCLSPKLVRRIHHSSKGLIMKNPEQNQCCNHSSSTSNSANQSSAGPLGHLLVKNKQWAERIQSQNPNFFQSLVNQQKPELLWIGCSDSRVPANEIVDLLPGEVFVHRNIANVVLHTDMNCLSVLQYAVEVLKVKHVIVCGHYGCGGVKAAMENQQYGLIDNWLRNIKDIYKVNQEKLDRIQDEKQRWDLMTELNVFASVSAVCQTTIVQNAWARGQPLSVHGWCYRLNDGRIRDLGVVINNAKEIDSIYRVTSNKVAASD